MQGAVGVGAHVGVAIGHARRRHRHLRPEQHHELAAERFADGADGADGFDDAVDFDGFGDAFSQRAEPAPVAGPTA